MPAFPTKLIKRSASAKLRAKVPKSVKLVQKTAGRPMVKDVLSTPEGFIDSAVRAAANSVVPGSGGLAVAAKNAISNGYSWVKDHIKAITGSGDYEVGGLGVASGNTLMNKDQIPRFSTNSRSVRLAHREFVMDVYSPSGASAYQLTQFGVSPSNGALFPWLSRMACLFNKFRIRGCVAEYSTKSSEYSTNIALGSIVMAHSSNPNPQPTITTTRTALEQFEGVVSVKPSESAICAFECDAAYQQMQWLQTGGTMQYQAQVGLDSVERILREHGRFYIAVDGCPTPNVKLGDLWISYDIEFYDQKSDGNSCALEFLLTNVGTSIAPLTGLGDLTKAQIANNGGVTITGPDGSGNYTVNFPSRWWGKRARVTVGWFGNTNLTLPCQFNPLYNMNGVTYFGNPSNGTSNWLQAVSQFGFGSPFGGPSSSLEAVNTTVVAFDNNQLTNPAFNGSAFQIVVNGGGTVVPASFAGNTVCLHIVECNGDAWQAPLTNIVTAY